MTATEGMGDTSGPVDTTSHPDAMRPRFRPRHKPIVTCVGLIALLAGLWVSLRYSLAAWGEDPDTSMPYLFWRGVADTGADFVRSFRFTDDNWIIWPLPLFWAVFETADAGIAVVVGLGWSMFVACTLLMFLIVRETSNRAAAVAAAVILLFSNRNAIGEMGFLTYPLTHNASMLGGLAALYAGLRVLNGHGVAWLAGVVAALVATAISDPWTHAAFTLPLWLAFGWLGLKGSPGADRHRARLVTLALGVATCLVYTRLFGTFDFLPFSPIRLADGHGVLHNLAVLGRLGAMWFNFLPGADADYRSPPEIRDVAFNLTILVSGLCAVAGLAWRASGASTAFDALVLTGSASCGVMVAAFVLLDTPKSLVSGRYLMAAYGFVVTLCVATLGRHWGRMSSRGHAVALGAGLLFCSSGLSSGMPVWSVLDLSVKNRGVAGFAAFLRSHGLHYGFGPDWGAGASAVTWATRGGVTMRPVDFDPATRRVRIVREQTSPSWYRPGDAGGDDPTTFLVISHGLDGCDDLQACAVAAEGQFGKPKTRMAYGDALVLVYDYRLLGADPNDLAGHAAPVRFGRKIAFTDSRPPDILGDGWAGPESIGTWSIGPRAGLLVKLPPAEDTVTIQVEASAFVPPTAKSQRVAVTFRGLGIAAWEVAPGAHRTYVATLSPALVRLGSGALEFAVPDAVSPRQAGVGDDYRVLGINVRSVAFLGTVSP